MVTLVEEAVPMVAELAAPGAVDLAVAVSVAMLMRISRSRCEDK